MRVFVMSFWFILGIVHRQVVEKEVFCFYWNENTLADDRVSLINY